MALKLKRVDGILWINKKISTCFFKLISIKNHRKDKSLSKVIITHPFLFNVDLSKYFISGDPYWKSFLELKSDALFYTEINDATIVSKGIVLDNKGAVILESTIFQVEYLNELCSNHFVKFHSLLPSMNEDKVLSLLNKLDNNYYHWSLESLTRILLIYEAPIFKKYKVAIKHEALPFVKDSLQFLFNLEDKQIIGKSLLKNLKVNKALVVSFPHIRNISTQNTNAYYPFLIRKLNKLAHTRLRETNNFDNTSANIIISRKNAIERRIINQATLKAYLKEYNFTIVFLEKLSYLQQVALFANANFVVAVHGAGITNIIYGKNTTLIELFPTERNIRDAYYFAQITGALGMQHHVIRYDSENEKQDVFLTNKLLYKIKETIKLSVNSSDEQKID